MHEQLPHEPDRPAWAAAADLIQWTTRPDSLWEPGDRFGSWFPGGRLNASVACVDRHAERSPDTIAFHWEGEPRDRRSVTYAALLGEVRALTRGLRGLGVGPGDVVALHLGWLPETVVAMFACARIGAAYAVVPQPLPAEALADRLQALAPKVLFTQDGAWRRGTVLPLKARADEALTALDRIEHTVVVRRTGIDVAWFEGDRWYHDLVAGTRPGQGHGDDVPTDVPSCHPLLLVSLANHRGRPVTVTVGTAAMLVQAAALHRWGLAAGRVLWCAGDVSWLGTQVHGIVGPLALGETSVMYEGTLDVPTHARAWKVMRRYDVTTLITTPSVLRTMRSWSFELDRTADAGALRRVVTFGEPGEPALRRWAAEGIGGPRISVADGWGQVELGGIVTVDAPVDPGRMPDAGAKIVDRTGAPVARGQEGELVLTRAWAGAMVGASGAVESIDDVHWRRFPGVYATGDRVRRHKDGRVAFLGRTDQVVSVSGQLVSLREVAEVLLDHPFVQAADVVERREPSGGRFLLAAVVLSPDRSGE
ncbi:MAG TPA: AMP-binding protein, partial [Candidatus Lustribacter sp.]|nr:AMP-binding protein [Candidatus Lustribacter sp.]